jgi:uncharacterized phage-associated protein
MVSYDNVKLAYIVLKTYDNVQKKSDSKFDKLFYNMTNLKLQKMSYFVYGLNFKNKELIPEFKKWKFGPVMEDVYSQVRSIDLGGYQISFAKYDNYIKTNFKNVYSNIVSFAKENENKISDTIEKLWKKNAFDMVEKSHGTEPWLKTSESARIDSNEIIKYFKNKKVEDIFS